MIVEQTPKALVHNLILLDESGSMQSKKKAVVNSVNNIIDTIRHTDESDKNQNQRVSLISFNGAGSKIRFLNELPDTSLLIGSTCYRPNSTSPLYDTIGQSIGLLKTTPHLSRTHHIHKDAFIVTLISDCIDSSSYKYCHNSIKSMVVRLKRYNWMFNLVGTAEFSKMHGKKIGISNYYQMSLPQMDMRHLMLVDKAAKKRLYNNLGLNSSSHHQAA